ncbi:MAG TPA: histidinol-phosphatase [Clostridia bacterium]|nr:histidinol-phosphatase [Clostridia bacterium]
MKKTDILYSDMHMHGSFSDGRGSLREFVLSAIGKGFKAIGFSDHVPVPIDNSWSMKLSDLGSYLEEADALKKEFNGILEIYTGIELDYIDGIDVLKYVDFESRGFDYFIGSVHYVYSEILGGHFEVDGPAESFKSLFYSGFGGDAKALVHGYYNNVRKMVEEYKPTVVGHIDLIKKNNGISEYFSEDSDFYKEEINETLDVIKKQGALLEINTGAISRGYTKIPYPSEYILKKSLEKGIGITLNSDAHQPSNVGYKFMEMIDMAKEKGFREIYFYNQGQWKSFSL